MIDAVRRYVVAESCPWETAISTAAVSKAEDVRWRDAVEAAEQAGVTPPELEAEWTEVWQASRDLVARVGGALYRSAVGGGRDSVSAAKALLPIEAGDAWGAGAGGRGDAPDEGQGLDEVAIDRLSQAQRRRAAELALVVRDARDELTTLMRDARSTAR